MLNEKSKKSEKSEKKENPHVKHRERLKNIYLKNGIEALSDIQVLELLLFYSIPRKDTNDIAHALLDEYSSLEGVLQADPERLTLIKGVGSNTAALIKLIYDINLRMETNRVKRGIIFSNPNIAGDYIKGFFTNKQHEMMYAFFLNKGNRLLGWEKIADGAVDSISVDTSNIIRAALKYKTCNVIIAHNHPGGKETPSQEDRITTGVISAALALVGLTLKDHFIITNDRFFSFSEANLFREDEDTYEAEVEDEDEELD